MPPLPSTNMTANWDASVSAGNLFASDPGNVPTGSVVDGDQVGAWVSTVDSNHYWRPDAGAGVFNPSNITWEDDAVLTLPTVKIAAGSMEPVTVTTGSLLRTDTFHTNSAKTLIFSFLIEDGTLFANNATVFLNSTLLGNPKNNYYTAFVRNDGGTLRFYMYNWDGSNDNIGMVVTAGTKYVAVVTHDGVDLSLTLMTPTGETTSTVASGNTTDIATVWRLADSNAAGSEQVKVRIGQITTWDAVLTGLDLSNAKAYYSDKWFNGALSGNLIRGSFVIGENGTVRSSGTGLINNDAVPRDINDVPGATHFGGNIVLHEQASAPIGYTGGARLYVVDNAGKLELQVIFPTGVAQVIATEP